MTENMTKCLHCGSPMKLIAFACPFCGMPVSVDPDESFSDDFLESIPIEDHLKTKPFDDVIKEPIDSDKLGASQDDGKYEADFDEERGKYR